MSRIHPDGAPGQREMYLRQQLGDAGYEHLAEHERDMRTISEAQAIAQLDLIRARVQLGRAVTALLVVIIACVGFAIGAAAAMTLGAL